VVGFATESEVYGLKCSQVGRVDAAVEPESAYPMHAEYHSTHTFDGPDPEHREEEIVLYIIISKSRRMYSMYWDVLGCIMDVSDSF
jgi:hypothetical protein